MWSRRQDRTPVPHGTLSSPPASSFIRNIAIARQRIKAAWEGRLANHHKRIERIAVLSKRSLDEAVVGRILGRGEQRTVQPDPASFMINFVLVLLTFGNLDGDIEGQTAERPLDLPSTSGAAI